MTSNAFIFAWDCYGIEAIVPISKYEHIDRDNTIRILSEQPTRSNPMDAIVRNLVMRAQVNPQRNYEIYAVDCSDMTMDEAFWRAQWENFPQNCADVIRERGQKIYSNRDTNRIDRVIR